MRTRRFALFQKLVEELPSPVRILDVGGTNEFWEQRGHAGDDRFQLTLLNLGEQERRWENIQSVAGDACDLSRWTDGSFDVAFSNSVIEHVFTFERQRAMAREIARVARCFWVQTPNYWFPMEPHFHMIGWQWYPRSVRVGLLMKRRCGWRGPCADRKDAESLVDEVRLMNAAELRTAFPDGTLLREHFYGLTKSFVVVRGFPALSRGKVSL
jgi:hypothetical protein